MSDSLISHFVRTGLVLFLSAVAFADTSRAEPAHGIAMHGTPGYPAGFTHFRYANPDAPKGGTLTLGVQGSFDSTNPLIISGVPAAGLRAHVFESLMARALDEPFSLYGLLAETIEVPDDRSWVAFQLNPAARFSDGRPVTADDVEFSHSLLRDHGRPNHRHYYSKVERIERPDDRTVKFVLKPDGDREMPLILGLMPIVPKHHYDPESFERTTLEPPLGSGPYVVGEVEPGSRITYTRNPDYWAKDLAPNAGRHNFDVVRYDYYRDANAVFEAFKKGLVDVRAEGDPTKWATAYDFPAVDDGRVIREEFETGLPSGMSAFVFNTRRRIFSDPRVRRGLIHMFDFEWANKSLFHGLYTRTQSYYDNSELASIGHEADEAEREILGERLSEIPADILAGTYRMPKTKGNGRNRRNRKIAIGLFKEAGYEIRDGVMVDVATSKPFAFEFMVAARHQERLVLHFARSLERIGIKVVVRQADSAQMQRRRQTYDFDMMQYHWFASLSPGNEQTFYWGAAGRDREGTRNYMGASDPAVDVAIAAMLEARERPRFVSAVRALDRVLLAGHYVVPLFHSPVQWAARWAHLKSPRETSLYGYQLDTWWREENQ